MQITNLSIDEVNCFDGQGESTINILWSANIGFGELTLYKRNEDEKWRAYTECMCNNEDKEFIRIVLNKWIDDMEVAE